jgi:hypothetical protein
MYNVHIVIHVSYKYIFKVFFGLKNLYSSKKPATVIQIADKLIFAKISYVTSISGQLKADKTGSGNLRVQQYNFLWIIMVRKATVPEGKNRPQKRRNEENFEELQG